MTQTFVDILNRSPLLLLFLVVALGWPLGKLKILGASLGMAAVLFVGIAIGSIPGVKPLPDIIYLLGLSLFVYTVGLTSAQGFFKAMNLRGLKMSLLTLLSLVFGACLVLLVAKLFHWNQFFGAGLFSGAFTNAPALAGAVEVIKAKGGSAMDLSQHTFAYSIAYPMGVMAPLLVILLSKKLFRVDLQKEAEGLSHYLEGSKNLCLKTLIVTRKEAEGLTRREVARMTGCDVLFGRVMRCGDQMVYKADMGLALGDLIMIMGNPVPLASVVALLGEESPEPVQNWEGTFQDKRVFVSNPEIVGRPLKELQLPLEYQAMVVRLRRGDLWFIPGAETRLELGDRLLVTAPRDRMDDVVALFGDSYRDISEADFLTFSLGLAAGLALGMVPIPLPGGLTFKLGFAGGPLVAALILGKVNRIGRFVWTFPFGANLTIRQLGLLLFSAGIGTIAGVGFLDNLKGGIGLQLFMAGLSITLLTDLFLVLVGYRYLKIPMNLLLGIVAGTQTMPVVLGSALSQTRNDIPSIGYASSYPLAMVLKIIFAQALLAVMGF